MFNSTHTLAGLAIARTGLGSRAPHAVWTAVIAANLPDIDILAQFYGTASYIEHHRGVTHSLTAIPLLAIAVAAVMHWRFGGFSGHLTVALAAVASHPLLDFANVYGVRPLLPFDSTWFYGDALFIIDPYVDLILLVSLVAGAYWKRQRVPLAIAGLALVAAVAAGRMHLRDMAIERIAGHAATLPGYERIAAFPTMLDPFSWTGLIETADEVFSMEVDVFDGAGREILRLPRMQPSPFVDAARSAQTVISFLDFARFPGVQVVDTPTGHRVVFVDLRFYRRNSGRGFAAAVELDRALRVTAETIGFNQPISAPASTAGSP